MSAHPPTRERLGASSHRVTRTPDAPTILVAGVWAALLDCLPLYQHDALWIERNYGLKPKLQAMLGYRSAPEPLRWRIPQVKGRDASRKELDNIIRRAHSPLDELSDEEFFDWLIYSKEPVPDPFSKLPTRRDETHLLQTIIESELQKRFGLVTGIPGLYHDGDCLRLKLPRSGVIIPARIDGLVRALQYYPDRDCARFFWVSSAGLGGGAPARASLHIVNGYRAVSDGAVILRHTMQADIQGWATGNCVIATNGISQLRLPYILRAALPGLSACAITSELGEAAARTLKEGRFEVEVFHPEGIGDE
jgi:hypothetical protein